MAEGEGFEPRYGFRTVVFKNTAISERLNMELRAEFFNILNHPNFANPLLPAFVAGPGSNLSNSCSCRFPAAGNRAVGNVGYQIVGTGDVSVGNLFLAGGGRRGIQLAA